MVPLFFILQEVRAPATDAWKAISTPLEIPGEPVEPSAVSNYIKGSLIMLGGVGILVLLTLCAGLKKRGFKQSKVDQAVFYKGQTIFIVYVDDGILIGPDKGEINEIIAMFK